MSELLVFALLLLAVIAGFALGSWTGHRRRRRYAQAERGAWLRQRYFEGLNHLLNEEPDAAIDTFVNALEVNSDTLETHFALGTLLRRRGEAERAIRVHQNLLARPSLDVRQHQQAQVELALDYMKSGLLDRAEALFKELLVSDDPTLRAVCLERLVEIYRDEKEWEQAIAMAEQLCHRKLGRDVSHWRALQAHFSCELSELAIERADWRAARERVQQALMYDKESIRARLNQARIDMSEQAFDQAVRGLEKISPGSSLFVSEAVPMLRECYDELGRPQAFRRFLEALYQREPSEMLLQHLSRAVYELDGEDAARALMARELPHFTSLAPMGEMLGIVERQAGCRVEYGRFAPVFDRMLAREGGYECSQCGFVGRQLHWCCPSCKSWGSMAARFTSDLGYDPEPVPI